MPQQHPMSGRDPTGLHKVSSGGGNTEFVQPVRGQQRPWRATRQKSGKPQPRCGVELGSTFAIRIWSAVCGMLLYICLWLVAVVPLARSPLSLFHVMLSIARESQKEIMRETMQRRMKKSGEPLWPDGIPRQMGDLCLVSRAQWFPSKDGRSGKRVLGRRAAFL